MHKTFSFSDTRVLDRLDEIKLMGIKPSKYISDLIIDDIENRRITIDDLARLFMAFTTMDNTNFKNSKDSISEQHTIESSQIKDKLLSVLDID